MSRHRQASAQLTALGLLLGAAARAEPVRNVSNTPLRAEGEESVAVNPTNPLNILVGSNQWQPMTRSNLGNLSLGPGGFSDCAVWSSHDGGATWTGGRMSESGLGSVALLATPASELPDAIDNAGSVITIDQNVLFDRRGTAWFQCINFGAGAPDPAVYVYRSADGGKSWEKLGIAVSIGGSGIQFDRSFLVVDDSGGPRDGTLYLTWETIFYQAWLPEVYVRKSIDRGETWGEVVRVDSGLQQTMWDPRQRPVMGGDGTLYVMYNTAVFFTPNPYDPGLTPLGIKVSRSSDGGKTFEGFVVESDVHHVSPPDEAFEYFTEFIPAIAADRVRGGRLAVAWPDGRSGEARVLLRYSLDAAASWKPEIPIDVADDPAGAGNQHDHVGLTYLPDGRLVAVWRDRRASGGGWFDRFEVFARAFDVAPDGTLTTGKVIRVTSEPQAPTTRTHGTMPTEYLDVTADAAWLYVAWDEMRGSFPDDVFRRIPLLEFDFAP